MATVFRSFLRDTLASGDEFLSPMFHPNNARTRKAIVALIYRRDYFPLTNAWAAACATACEALSVAREVPVYFQIGFLFDKPYALYRGSLKLAEHTLLINPSKARSMDGKLGRLTVSDSRNWMRSLAIHEAAHIVSLLHDEIHAAVMSDILAFFDDVAYRRRYKAWTTKIPRDDLKRDDAMTLDTLKRLRAFRATMEWKE